ncbi:MAG: LysR family transcriptional regulator, partial [Actinomycetia bacterium]|nr:LysR family transcriptional regulator [Actinomycetes bacterium]
MASNMQLDTESLRTLLAVLEHGGMSKAASRLGMSQSAVSWKIKRLEEKVGRPLLIREGHSLRPTRDGHQVVEQASQIVELHDLMIDRLSSSDLTGRVRLGATEEVSALCIKVVLARFNRIHPETWVEFFVDRGHDLEEMVQRGDLDIAVFQAGAEVSHGDVVLAHDELVWVCAAEAQYSEGDVPLITFGRQGFYGPFARAALDAAGIDHWTAFSGPSSAGVLAAVEAGLGVALLSRRALMGNVIEWPRSADFAPTPDFHTVARVSPGEPSRAAAELMG